ncbi:MAG: hypothetical protein ACKOA0_06740, partial [Burkholderiaceae bacterium]
IMMDLLNISVKGENKVLFLNFGMMSKLFDEAYHTFGQGRFIRLAEQQAAEAAAEAEAAAAAAAEAAALADGAGDAATLDKA